MKYKTVLLGVSLLLLSSTVSAQTPYRGVSEFTSTYQQGKNITTSFRSDGVRFTTDSFNRTLSYKAAYIPPDLRDDLAKWNLKNTSKNGDLEEVQVQYEFVQEKSDPDGDVPSALYGYKFDSKVTFNKSGVEEFKAKGGRINVVASSPLNKINLSYGVFDGSGNKIVGYNEIFVDEDGLKNSYIFDVEEVSRTEVSSGVYDVSLELSLTRFGKNLVGKSESETLDYLRSNEVKYTRGRVNSSVASGLKSEVEGIVQGDFSKIPVEDQIGSLRSVDSISSSGTGGNSNITVDMTIEENSGVVQFPVYKLKFGRFSVTYSLEFSDSARDLEGAYSCTISDVDYDGSKEMLTSSDRYGHHLRRYSLSGLEHSTEVSNSASSDHMLFKDMDGDGTKTIFVAEDNNISEYRWNSGSYDKIDTVDTGGRVAGFEIYDGYSDSGKEIYVTIADDTIKVFNSTFSQVDKLNFTADLSDSYPSGIDIHDADNDGTDEVVFGKTTGTFDEYVYVYDTQLGTQEAKVKTDEKSPPIGDIDHVDWDGDGVNETLFVSSGAHLYQFETDYTLSKIRTPNEGSTKGGLVAFKLQGTPYAWWGGANDYSYFENPSGEIFYDKKFNYRARGKCVGDMDGGGTMEIGSTDDGSMEIYSLSFPSPPEFNSQELIFQGIGGSETRSVNYSIQGNGGSDDITNHNTPPSGVVAKFTNSSYKVSGVSQIFDYLARITDSDSEKATIETNFTFSESSFLEDDYGQSLKNQRANKTAALDNRGDPTNYSLDMVCSSGSRVLGGSSSGTLASGESISETIVCEGDWLTISSESSVAKGSDGSYTHTLGTQGIFNTTRLSVSNSRSFTFTGVDISSECSMDTSADVPAGTNTVTSECNNATFTGDWISVSQKSSVKKGSDDSYAHTLDSQGIFNTTSLTVSNSKSFTFSGVDISNECSVDTSADVPAGTNTVTGSCNNNTFTGDWITGVAESLYSQYEASGYSHNTTHQKLVNQTKLMADNARSSTFQDVDISARCSSTTTADVAAGTGVEVTNDCNRNRYVEDWISDGVSGLRQDQSQVSDHNTQYLYKKKWVNETGGYAFSDVTVPSVSMPGTCSNCGTRKPSLSAHENHSEFYNSSGDWIKSEAGYGTEYKSGVVRYGPGVTNDYTATENVQLENTRGDISLAVDVTGPASSVEQCSIKNSSTQVVPAAAKTNFTLFKSCTPGAELEYDPVEKTETQDYFVYNYSATTEVYTDVTDEQSHRYCAPMDRFPNWGSRDPSETTVTVDGSSKDVSVAAESIGGAEYLCITTGDEHTNSSKHDGTHTEAVVYKEKKNTGNIGGGLVGGGGGGSEEELVNVTGQYNWSVSSISSEGDRSFQLFGYPGRSFNIPLTVENTGASNVTIDIECRSSDGSCNWVGPSTDQVKLNAKSFQESIVRIKGKIPENASKERYRFVIRFTDPSYNPENPGAGGYADVDFSISMNRIAGVAFSTWNSFVDVIGKLGEWKEFDLSKVFGDQAGTLSVPFVVLPLIPSVLSFIVMRAASDKGGAVLFLHVVGFIVLFLILTAAVPI